jgi:hypothetical protein
VFIEALKPTMKKFEYFCKIVWNLHLVQPCDETPCKNDGECENVDKETFKCNCTEAWTGKTCEEKGEFLYQM